MSPVSWYRDVANVLRSLCGVMCFPGIARFAYLAMRISIDRTESLFFLEERKSAVSESGIFIPALCSSHVLLLFRCCEGERLRT